MDDKEKIQLLRQMVTRLRDDLVLQVMDSEFEECGCRKGWEQLEPLLREVEMVLEVTE
jgi:hypothetical protein